MANTLYGAVYVSSLYVALSYAFANGFPTSSSVELWAGVQLVATVAFMLLKARRARKHAKLLPGISVAHFVLAAAVMAGVVYELSGEVVNRGLGTLTYGLQLLGLAAVGAAVYFGLVYAMDSRFRDMSRSLLRKLGI